MDIKKIFGDNLKFYRKDKGYTQETLSEALGISINHLANLELGKKFVSANLLERISTTLEVSPSTLFYSVDLVSLDNTAMTKIDRIIEEQAKVTRMMVREMVK